MKDKRRKNTISGDLALHALGLLPPEQASRVESKATTREAIQLREVAARIAFTAPPERPPVSLRQRLMSHLDSPSTPSTGPQVWKSWQPEAPDRLHVVRASQGPWEPTGIPGITVKRLFADPRRDSVTMLIRMEPGTAYPAHRHGGPEECLVLEGDVQVGDVSLQAGDYQCVPFDSVHDVTRTTGGCLLLIMSSQHDQLLA